MLTSGKGSVVEKLAEEAFRPLHVSGEGLTRMDGPAPSLTYNVSEHVKSLNPLVEAAIAERALFDGDVPELRTGPLPPGATPAVPVLTDAVDPVALGVEMEIAAEGVKQEMQHALEDHAQAMTTLLEDAEHSDPGTALQIKEHLPPVPRGVPGYEAGQTPALRTVEKPSGAVLATLSDSQRQTAAYRALSTTQGRRSAVRSIEEALLVGLIEEGFEMSARTPTHKLVDVTIYAEWSSQITGEAETNPNFSFITVAIRSLLRSLTEQVREKGLPTNPVLEVLPKNTVDVRQVGWAARIVSED
jgi:hypothetical protein